MSFILHPWQMLLAILAGWIHEQQQHVIEYQRTENQVLKEKLGKKRILLDEQQFGNDANARIPHPQHALVAPLQDGQRDAAPIDGVLGGVGE